MKIITVKNTLIDQYFYLNLENLSHTHLMDLEELNDHPSLFTGLPANLTLIKERDYLVVKDTLTPIYTYLTTNHPELFI